MNKVIAFHGAEHRCGTTQITQCCAEYIAENTDMQVLLLLGSGGRGGQYCEVHESMDYLRPYLAENLIDVTEIKSKALKKGNLSIIGGYENPEALDLFSVDMTERLVRGLKKEYDVILLDSGSHIELGSGFGYLMAADKIYMLINQLESSFRNLEWAQELYVKLGICVDHYIVNKYERKSAYEPDYIEKRLLVDRKNIYRIRKHKYGDWAEMDAKSLMQCKGSRGFIRDIKKLSEDIIAYVKDEV